MHIETKADVGDFVCFLHKNELHKGEIKHIRIDINEEYEGIVYTILDEVACAREAVHHHQLLEKYIHKSKELLLKSI